MNETDKTYATARYYVKHALHYPRLLIGVLITVPLTVLVNSFLPPLLLADVLDRLSKHDYIPNDVWQSFGGTLILYAAVVMTGVLTWRMVDHFVWKLEQTLLQDLSEEVFAHMLDESADFHANNFGGSLVSKANKLLGSYIRLADTTIFTTYPMLISLVLTAIILGPRAPLYVVFLLIFSTLFIFGALKISRPVRKASGRYAEYESQQTGYLADAITNVMAVKSFARKDYERRRYHVAATKTKNGLMEVARAHRTQMNILGVMSRTMSGLAFAIAVISVVSFGANIATVFLIFSYTASIVDQLFQFSNNSLRNYNRAIGDASDMVEILARTPEILDDPSPEKVRIEQGSIQFNDVSFTHTGADDAIFDSLSLQIKHNEKVGLIGHSGSGKSTFVRLLLRFSDIDDGEILIDGQNIAKIKQEDLHANIAYVPQEPLLFHRTIEENIAYGKPKATQAEIITAAQQANAHEFISELPHGYQTLVGERGVKLSGGQRQRVAIARALLKNAPVLVLDEATSALDSESEAQIQDALWKLMQGRTAIVIAHRLSTIQKMDRIVVLDNGQIVEQGTHQELLRHDGVYAKLWAHQSGGFIED